MKVKEFLKSAKYKQQVKPEIKRFLAVLIFTFIYGIGVAWFLEDSVIPLYTGGMPGIAQVIRDILVQNGTIEEVSGKTLMSIFIIVSNIPLLILGWFGVSKKFTLYSLLSVIVQSTVIGFIPNSILGLSSPTHALLASILGGLLIGIGVGGSLKYGGSTGGIDIIAQYFSLKKGKSVGFISLGLNVLIAIFGAAVSGNKQVMVLGTPMIFSWGVILSYTIVRIIVTTLATDYVHTSYQYLSVEIITENPKILVNEILTRLGRGVTLSKVEGAYSSLEKTMVMVVISNYELVTMTEIIREIDMKAFVMAKPVKNVIGNFKKKRIA